MNKNDLIRIISEKTGETQEVTRKLFESTFKEITRIMADGNSINFPGFGTFHTVKRDKRKGFNPLIEKWMMLPPKIIPKFKSSDKIKEVLNISPETRIIEK